MITLCGVESSRDYHQVGFEFANDGEEHLLARKDIVLVSDDWLLVFCHIEREVDIEAFASTLTNSSMRSRLPRIELALVKPVNGYVQHRRVIVENLGSSVANVDIPVEDANLLGPVFLLGHACGHSCIVIKAETCYLVVVSVVARRSYYCEGLINERLRADTSNSLDCATCCERSSLISVLVHVCVNLACANVLIAF